MDRPVRTRQFAKAAQHRWLWLPLLAALVAVPGGCYAPLHSTGVPASALPDSFRTPYRTAGPGINYAALTLSPPADYLLGAGDTISVTIPGLYVGAETTPIVVQVMSSGEIHLPLVGAVRVKDFNLLQAQRKINEAFANGFLKNPRINVALVQKSTMSLLVLGEVKLSGVHVLSKYENDIGHALAAAGGLTQDAAGFIEVHRKPNEPHSPSDVTRLPPLWGQEQPPLPCGANLNWQAPMPNFVERIALTGPGTFEGGPRNVALQSGDVVVVPSRRHEVFYVVGRLSQTNTVRFTVGDRERELGVGFILPRDREIDVVTAVAMAGYIDPIDSPTTVLVHRRGPNGCPLLIKVDLIKARYDPRETVLVHPGDIIYLNPDGGWWFRRTLDRVVPDLITLPYNRAVGRR